MGDCSRMWTHQWLPRYATHERLRKYPPKIILIVADHHMAFLPAKSHGQVLIYNSSWHYVRRTHWQATGCHARRSAPAENRRAGADNPRHRTRAARYAATTILAAQGARPPCRPYATRLWLRRHVRVAPSSHPRRRSSDGLDRQSKLPLIVSSRDVEYTIRSVGRFLHPGWKLSCFLTMNLKDA